YKGNVVHPGGPFIRPDESNDKPIDVNVDIDIDPFGAELVIHARNSEAQESGVLSIYSTEGILRYSQKIVAEEIISLKQNLVTGVYLAIYQNDAGAVGRSILVK